jgi:hypothetical protein
MKTIGPGGKVDTVNEIAADGYKNIQINLTMTKADFETQKGDIEIGQVVTQIDVSAGNAVVMDVFSDDDNQDPVDHFANTKNASWTVLADGFVRWQSRMQVPTGGYCTNSLLKNGKVVAGGIYTATVGTSEATYALIKVKAGDVISQSSDMTLYFNYLYWVPPLYTTIPRPQFQVKVGTDYSLSEQPVLVMDPATKEIRQQLDLDGSPIWEQTFTGTRSWAANTQSDVVLIPSGIKRAWLVDGTQQLGVNMIDASMWTWAGRGLQINVLDYAIRYQLYCETAVNNQAYQLRVRYTKV